MKYVLNRVGFLLISLWAAATINFFLPRMMPGNPVDSLIARFQGRISGSALHAIELQFGITHQPLWFQYLAYLNHLLHGNFGVSLTYYPASVMTVIGNSLPWTLGLAGLSTVISVALGLALGIYSAWHRKGWLANALPTMSTFTAAIPFFWLAMIFVYLLGYLLGWFPTDHAYTSSLVPGINGPFILSVLHHGILPACTIVISSLGGWLMNMRNNMVQILGEDYILFAQAKGVPDRALMLRYAARNAILPIATSFAMSIGFVVGGTLLTEIVFSYPGVGYQLFTAIENSDYPLMQGLFLMIAVSVLLANFAVEMLYGRLDPRVRRSGV